MAAQRVTDVPADAAEHVVGSVVEVFAVSVRNGNHFGIVLVNVQPANLLDDRFIKLLRAFGRFFAVAAAENNADFGLVETPDMGIGVFECCDAVFRSVFQNGVTGFKTDALVGEVIDVFQFDDQHGKGLVVTLGAVEVVFQPLCKSLFVENVAD